MEKEIIYYYTLDGKCPFKEWLYTLDATFQVRIEKRINRLKNGLYGDYKQLQNSELSELRLDFGAGYRIYYKDLDGAIILFVAGSDKSNQKKTIKQTEDHYNDFERRRKERLQNG